MDTTTVIENGTTIALSTFITGYVICLLVFTIGSIGYFLFALQSIPKSEN